MHGSQHFLHSGRQTDGDRPADDVVADVQFLQVRNHKEGRHIANGQTMTRVDTNAPLMREIRRIDQALQFQLTTREVVKGLRITARVKFNELGSDTGGSLHLGGIR